MDAEYILTLPIPPTVNTYYGKSPSGVIYLNRAGRVFRADVDAALTQAKIDNDWPLTGRLAMDVEISFRDRRKSDLDNRLKPLLDAMEASRVFVNDQQIDWLRVRRGPVTPGGRCVVTLRTITPDTMQQVLPFAEGWP